jgi:hypothetical protein
MRNVYSSPRLSLTFTVYCTLSLTFVTFFVISFICLTSFFRLCLGMYIVIFNYVYVIMCTCTKFQVVWKYIALGYGGYWSLFNWLSILPYHVIWNRHCQEWSRISKLSLHLWHNWQLIRDHPPYFKSLTF